MRTDFYPIRTHTQFCRVFQKLKYLVKHSYKAQNKKTTSSNCIAFRVHLFYFDRSLQNMEK